MKTLKYIFGVVLLIIPTIALVYVLYSIGLLGEVVYIFGGAIIFAIMIYYGIY